MSRPTAAGLAFKNVRMVVRLASRIRTLLSSLALVCLVWLTGNQGRAEVFLLVDGGRVEGEWLNASATDLKHYEIRLDRGGLLKLDARQVRKVIPLSDAKRQYREWLKQMPASADGNWQMAKWCLKKGLAEERAFHLDEAIRLDPNHEEARRSLGFKYVDGQWVLADDLMIANGFVKYQGRWRMPHDVAVLEAAAARREKVAVLKKKIRLWRKAIGTSREAEAVAELLALRDPLAAPLVVEAFEEEPSLALVGMWIRVLGNLPGGVASAALVRGTLESPSQEVRTACLDQLEQRGGPYPLEVYHQALKSPQNERVRRAAAALDRFGDESSIVPLMRALVTNHKEVLVEADPNRLSAAFGSGSNTTGSGFSTGNRPKVLDRPYSNRETLEALMKITGENYQYNESAWLAWYIERESPPPGVSLRRDP